MLPAENDRSPVEVTGDEDGCQVAVGMANEPRLEFDLLPPAALYLMARDLSMDIPTADVIVKGGAHETGGPSSVFRFLGNNRLICNKVTFDCRSIDVRGPLYIDAQEASIDAATIVRKNTDAGTYLSTALSTRRPWSDVQSEPAGDDGPELSAFLREFTQRTRGVGSIVVRRNYRITDDKRWGWIANNTSYRRGVSEVYSRVSDYRPRDRRGWHSIRGGAESPQVRHRIRFKVRFERTGSRVSWRTKPRGEHPGICSVCQNP